MSLFNYGQPVNGMCQLGYIVEDVHAAMEKFTRNLNAGPWFLMEGVTIQHEYRRKPNDFHGNLACGNTGHMMIELIQQLDDTPSVFTEIIKTRGYGLHHLAIGVSDFEQQLELYKRLNYEVALYTKSGMNHRVAYMDSKGKFPHFLELIEMNVPMEAVFAGVYRASIGWDGKDPVRDFGATFGHLGEKAGEKK